MTVTADECLEGDEGGVFVEHRCLMVVALWDDRQRSGAAHEATESLFCAMQADDARSVRWLAHLRHEAAIAFRRSVFADAEEAYQPEDCPRAAFVLDLRPSPG